jgi:hypothetical protein
MSIVGFLETDLHFGTVNTSASTSKQQNFGAPLTVWSRPYLQQVSVNDDDGSVILWVSEYKNNTGAHSGKFVPEIYSEKCTSGTTGSDDSHPVVAACPPLLPGLKLTAGIKCLGRSTRAACGSTLAGSHQSS